jgi:Protein of unknown function (DUF3373)
MRRFVRTAIAGAALLSFALPLSAGAQDKESSGAESQDQDLEKQVEELAKQLDALKEQNKRAEEKSLNRWLTIGGDYRFRLDSLHGDVPDYFQFVSPMDAPVLTPGYEPHNDTLMTNRFGLNIKAKATQDVSVYARLVMYKTTGMSTDRATNAGFFADRSFALDGTLGHVPLDNTLRVDQVFATWSNIAGQPLWFSVGRRPSTGGSPSHLRRNDERPGNGGVPALLVDYAFDGMTLGYAPDTSALPGAYVKACYGRGFEAGYSSQNNLNDTEMVGVQVVPVDTDPIRIDFQWNRGYDIFDNPNNVGAQLGDIDWYGVGLLSSLKGFGPGTLHWFASVGASITHPNGKHALFPGGIDSGAGLLVNGADDSEHEGYAGYGGFRYDLPSSTKIGGEYNHGTKYWVPFDPASDDMWTAKLGTRGDVYEGYLIQELRLQPISSFVSKAFFKIGYQYYEFEYTGSNNWVGAPVKMSELTASPFNAQMMPPVKYAHNYYATFEVKF